MAHLFKKVNGDNREVTEKSVARPCASRVSIPGPRDRREADPDPARSQLHFPYHFPKVSSRAPLSTRLFRRGEPSGVAVVRPGGQSIPPVPPDFRAARVVYPGARRPDPSARGRRPPPAVPSWLKSHVFDSSRGACPVPRR